MLAVDLTVVLMGHQESNLNSLNKDMVDETVVVMVFQ